MKVGEAKEENEGMKDCRTQAVTVHSDATKISRARFYFRVERRKCSLICPKLLQPALERHQGAHCQAPGVLLFLCRTKKHRSLFTGSRNRSLGINQMGKVPNSCPGELMASREYA